MDSRDIIKAENISKSYGDEKVIDRLSINLSNNQVIGLIGPSGCGKTTLLKCINLLEKIDSGEITYRDTFKICVAKNGKSYKVEGESKKSIIEEDLIKVRKKIGIVFQEFNLWESKTVIQNLKLAPKVVLSKEEVEVREKAEKLCKSFGLGDKIDSIVGNLSGGQRQRVAIIRALMMDPEVILLDEVTSSLDPLLTADVIEAITKLRDRGGSMIIVSHHIDFISKISDKLMYMEDGSIIQSGRPSELIDNPSTEKIAEFISTLKLAAS